MDNVDNGAKDGEASVEKDVEANAEKYAEANVESKDDADKSIVPSDVPVEMVPQLFMEFDSEKDAYDYYNRYAIKAGFSVRRGRDHRNKLGELQDKSFFCSCEGFSVKDKRDENVRGSRLLTRNGCKAHMKVSNRPTGKFRVVRFVAEHNHKLAPPNMCHLLRSQRFLPTVVQRANNGASRVSTNSIDSHSDVQDEYDFVPVDYKNSLCTKRARQMKVGDAGGILEYLQQMGEDDPNFFYAIQVDAEDKITNIFWADGKMMIDYGYFGDVVCFDTTYKRSNENLPFCVFTGVNNHKQTITFGAAFLYDKSIDSFKWLFDTFIKAMGGKKPKTILTEHDEAMSSALTTQWPETHHRLCVWDIYQDILRQLSNLNGINSKFSKDLQSSLYDYEEENEFENAWCELLKKYDLTEHPWLNQLYADKEKWALAYGRDKFCADMINSQRNDCMNSQLKKYIDSQLDIRHFLQVFNTLIEDTRDEELRKDFKASHAIPTLVFQSEILKQAAFVYTPALFLVFQSEMEKVWDSEMLIASEVGTLGEYKITPFGKTEPRIVKFDSENCAVVCSCQKFEFVGILCAHALKVMAFKNIRRIPDQYMVKRWTKDAKDRRGRINHESTAIVDYKKELTIRHRDLRINFNKLAAKAAETEETYVFALTEFDRLLAQVEDRLKQASLCVGTVSEFADIDALNENRTNLLDYDNDSSLTSKGRKKKKFGSCPSAKRKKGAFTKAMTKGNAQKDMAKASELSAYSQPIMVQTNNIMSTPFNQQEPRETTVLGSRTMDRCASQPFSIVQPSPHEMFQPISNSESYVHAISYQNSNVPNGQGGVGMNQALSQVTCKWI
uniref:Protein FAR1-RELATED SEQUENCE n=1 Tax=Anthurium amnicola TaxID=1678845 RepID=A0A1D1YUK7_9ARAE